MLTAAARNLSSQLNPDNTFQSSALLAIRDELISSKTATTIANMKTYNKKKTGIFIANSCYQKPTFMTENVCVMTLYFFH